MTEAHFTDRPISNRVVVIAGSLAGLAVAYGPAAASGAPPLGAVAGAVALAAVPLWCLRARHGLRLVAGRLVVGSSRLGGFDVPLARIERWRVLDRAEALEVRATLGGSGRVALLPWLPAAAILQLDDGGLVLVGTRRPEALHALLAHAAPYREAHGDVARQLEAPRGSEADTLGEASEAARLGAATGGAAVLLLGTAALFGALVSLLVLDAATSLPGGFALTGTVAGPVVGALVVAEAAARTPLTPAGTAALAAGFAGLAPPAAAALAGATLSATALLGLATVSIAFVTATLHRGGARS